MNREEFNEVLQYIDLNLDDLEYSTDSYSELIDGIENKIIKWNDGYILKEQERLNENQKDLEILQTHPTDKFTEKHLQQIIDNIERNKRSIDRCKKKIQEASKILNILERLE